MNAGAERAHPGHPKAPVELLWNGGIGTYVKASTESHGGRRPRERCGSRGRHRLRAEVVGEGGNLGFTQRGRIEYAMGGGRINTDAIDNSAASTAPTTRSTSRSCWPRGEPGELTVDSATSSQPSPTTSAPRDLRQLPPGQILSQETGVAAADGSVRGPDARTRGTQAARRAGSSLCPRASGCRAGSGGPGLVRRSCACCSPMPSGCCEIRSWLGAAR